MIRFKLHLRSLSLCSVMTLACGAPQNLAASGTLRPERVTVRLDGPVVEVSFDGERFVPWSSAEGFIGTSTEDGPEISARLHISSTTAENLLIWTHKLQRLLGHPVTIEVSRADDGRVIDEIRVTDSLNRFLEDDESGCAQIEAFDDGQRFMIRIRDTARRQSRPRTPALRSATDALLVMITDEIWYSNRLSTRAEDMLACEELGSSEQCEGVLAQSLDNILRIGVPCGKAFVYVPARLGWPRLAMIFKSLKEIGAEEALIKTLNDAELRAEFDAPE